jgi:hypothetical protein
MVSPINIPIQIFSDLPKSGAGRSFLRSHFIDRDLSRLLILILLILSPLTFSNDNIPNFQPDGVSNFSLSTKSCRTVAVVRSEKSPTVVSADAGIVLPQTSCSLPHITPVCLFQISRAPPA